MASDKSLLGKLAATARRVADVAEAADKANPFAKKETAEASETLQTPETPETPSPSDARPATEKKGAFARVSGVAENFASFAKKESAQSSVPVESPAASEKPSESEPQAEENTVEPLPPAPPQIPESFGDEVFRERDVVFYRGGLVKGNRVVDYRSATRVLLNTNARVFPGAPGYCGRDGILETAFDGAELGSIVPGGMLAGAAVGGVLGLLNSFAPATEELHKQIWLEASDSPEPILLYSDKICDKLGARVLANIAANKIFSAFEKAGAEPEILLDGQKVKRNYRWGFLLLYQRRRFF
ncbi:MAG: hypothetical protein IJO06_09855 [Thermoguttaceae bacterium]|nr:hypothetical protein [Thermoguttaceae bacterium]